MKGDVGHFFGGPWDGRRVPLDHPTREFHVPQVGPYLVHIYRREPCPRDSFNSCAIRYDYIGIQSRHPTGITIVAKDEDA